MRATLQTSRVAVGTSLWRGFGQLGTLAPRLTAVALLSVGLWVTRIPATPDEVAPQPVAPAVPVAESTTPVIVADPMLAQVDDILARKAPGLGLAVRGQLAKALVEESNAAHLDPLLTLAVMRVESEFDDDATSVRGARGLMQMKPTTLAFIAHQQGIRLPTEEILRDPVLSTRLAVRYLGRLNQAFHGDLDAALMAYNAGPHRISSARAEHDADRFLIYPRNVRRAWRHLRALPPSDDQTVAERDVARH